MSNPYDLSGVKVDGIIFDSVMSGVTNGEYILRTRGCNLTADQVRNINWAEPTIENLSTKFRCQLPQGYGYVLDDADYCLKNDEWKVTVHMGRQFLGDVSQYQGQIEDLNAALESKTTELNTKTTELEAKTDEVESLNTELQNKEAALSEKDQEIENLNAALAEADELAISLFEQIEGGESGTATPENSGNGEETPPTDDTETNTEEGVQ